MFTVHDQRQPPGRARVRQRRAAARHGAVLDARAASRVRTARTRVRPRGEAGARRYRAGDRGRRARTAPGRARPRARTGRRDVRRCARRDRPQRDAAAACARARPRGPRRPPARRRLERAAQPPARRTAPYRARGRVRTRCARRRRRREPEAVAGLDLRACDLRGVPPAQAVALEDSPPGVAAARAAGLLVVGVPSVDGVELPPTWSRPRSATPACEPHSAWTGSRSCRNDGSEGASPSSRDDERHRRRRPASPQSRSRGSSTTRRCPCRSRQDTRGRVLAARRPSFAIARTRTARGLARRADDAPRRDRPRCRPTRSSPARSTRSRSRPATAATASSSATRASRVDEALALASRSSRRGSATRWSCSATCARKPRLLADLERVNVHVPVVAVWHGRASPEGFLTVSVDNRQRDQRRDAAT